MKLTSAVVTLACTFAVCLAKCREPTKPKFAFAGCEWQLEAGAPDDSTCPKYTIKCDDSVDQTCILNMDSGEGNAIKLRYHFDPRYNRCFPFPYGGSAGNANNFETRAACAERCKSGTTESSTENGSGRGPPPPTSGTSSSCADLLCPINSRCEDGRCVSNGDPKCSDNEEIKNCGACDATCTNQNIACPMVCRAPECGCKSNFVRDANNKCVDKSLCSPLSTPPPAGPCATVRCSSDTTCVGGICVKKDNNCGINMHFEECGSACPAVCGSELTAVNCVARCNPGCVCNNGFVLDRVGGSCVRREDCQRSPEIVPPNNCALVLCRIGSKCVDGTCVEDSQDDQCGANMHYDSCGTACPALCGSGRHSRVCTANCKSGCFCDRDFVLDTDGKCVRREDCKSKNDNCATVRCQVGYLCINGECAQRKDCPDVKLQAAPVGCTYQQELNAQGCIQWNLLCSGGGGSSSGTSCGPNAEESDCASACPTTCDNRGLLSACPAVCKQGCVCKPGFVFKSSNLQEGCVRSEECPIPGRNPSSNPSGLQCGQNEIEKQCGACDSHCNQQTRACELVCRQPECGCIDGYRRNNQNKCVAEAECSAIGDCSVMLCIPGTICINGQCVSHKINQTCGANEELKECGTACEPTCDNPKPDLCSEMCKVNACQCQSGFVRLNDFCIEPSNCEAIKTCAAVSCLAGTNCINGQCVAIESERSTIEE